jgi:hypothetical protein
VTPPPPTTRECVVTFTPAIILRALVAEAGAG